MLVQVSISAAVHPVSSSVLSMTVEPDKGTGYSGTARVDSTWQNKITLMPRCTYTLQNQGWLLQILVNQ